MAKSVKAYTILADRERVIWAEGEFTQALTNKFLRLYKRWGIDLDTYGSVNQLSDTK